MYGSVCPLFGIRYRYKYRVDYGCRSCLSFMVAVEHDGFLQNSNPCLICKERIVLAVYLSLPGTCAHLRSSVASRTFKGKQLAGLYRLVFQYTWALLVPPYRRGSQACFALSTTDMVPVPPFASCISLFCGEGWGPLVPSGMSSGQGHQHHQFCRLPEHICYPTPLVAGYPEAPNHFPHHPGISTGRKLAA